MCKILEFLLSQFGNLSNWKSLVSYDPKIKRHEKNIIYIKKETIYIKRNTGKRKSENQAFFHVYFFFLVFSLVWVWRTWVIKTPTFQQEAINQPKILGERERERERGRMRRSRSESARPWRMDGLVKERKKSRDGNTVKEYNQN